MANEYSILRQIPPPQQVADVDFQFKALAYKQKKFDEGFSEFKSNFTAVANIDIARESGQKYLQQRLNAVTSQLNGNVYDFSDSSVSNNLVGTIGQTFDKTVVQEVVDTRRLRKAQTEIAELKEANDGRYSERNHWDAMQGVTDYLESDNLKTRLPNIDYQNFVDIQVKKEEFFDKLFKNSEKTVEIPEFAEQLDSKGNVVLDSDGNAVKVPTGRMRKVSKIGLSSADIASAFEASLDPQDKTQIGIDARYAYRDSTPEQLQSGYDVYIKNKRAELIKNKTQAVSSGNTSLAKRYGEMVSDLENNTKILSRLPQAQRGQVQKEFLMKQGYIGNFERQYQKRVTEEIFKKDDVHFANLLETDREFKRNLDGAKFDRESERLNRDFKIRERDLELKEFETLGGALITPSITGVTNISAPTDNLPNASSLNTELQKSYQSGKSGMISAVGKIYDELSPTKQEEVDRILSLYREDNPDVDRSILLNHVFKNFPKYTDGASTESIVEFTKKSATFEDVWQQRRDETNKRASSYGEVVYSSGLKSVFKVEEFKDVPAGASGVEGRVRVQSDRGLIRGRYNEIAEANDFDFRLVGDGETLADTKSVNSTNAASFFNNDPVRKKQLTQVMLADVVINQSRFKGVAKEADEAMKALARSMEVSLDNLPQRGRRSVMLLDGTFGDFKFEGGDEKMRNFLNTSISTLKGGVFTNPFGVDSILEDGDFKKGVTNFEGTFLNNRASSLLEGSGGGKNIPIAPTGTKANPQQRAFKTMVDGALIDSSTRIRNKEGEFVPVRGELDEFLREKVADIEGITTEKSDNPVRGNIQMRQNRSLVEIGGVELEVENSKLLPFIKGFVDPNFDETTLSQEGLILRTDRNFTTPVRTVDRNKVVDDFDFYTKSGFSDSDIKKITPKSGTNMIVNKYKGFVTQDDVERLGAVLENADKFKVNVRQRDSGVTMEIALNGEDERRVYTMNPDSSGRLNRTEQNRLYDKIKDKVATAPSFYIYEMLDEIISDSLDPDETPIISLDDLFQLINDTQ